MVQKQNPIAEERERHTTVLLSGHKVMSTAQYHLSHNEVLL